MEPLQHQVTEQKARGAYYTPPETAAALVRWAVRSPEEHMLDPSCGDGRFLALHPRSTGVDCDASAVSSAAEAAPRGTVECADFFDWAAATSERFDCAAGNPPFIRFQRFNGETRRQALKLCASLGAKLSGLCSSWVPYLIVTASLLRQGGRMAFVVPAEIGHAPYAAPLLDWLARHFSEVRLVAVRQKLFTELSEDVWLLYADGFGGRTDHFDLALHERFVFRSEPPIADTRVSVREWRRWGSRLRPMLCRPGFDPSTRTSETRNRRRRSATWPESGLATSRAPTTSSTCARRKRRSWRSRGNYSVPRCAAVGSCRVRRFRLRRWLVGDPATSRTSSCARSPDASAGRCPAVPGFASRTRRAATLQVPRSNPLVRRTPCSRSRPLSLLHEWGRAFLGREPGTLYLHQRRPCRSTERHGC